MVLKVKRLRPEAVVPSFAHPDDSGMDIHAVEDAVLPPGAWAKLPTGLAFEPPPGTELQVRPRSGLAARHGISMVNAPATIDEGYRGEVAVILVNLGNEPFRIARGDRIAQIVLCPVLRPEVVETDSLSGTSRGSGGFGTTGV